jgi:hypothetical protein
MHHRNHTDLEQMPLECYPTNIIIQYAVPHHACLEGIILQNNSLHVCNNGVSWVFHKLKTHCTCQPESVLPHTELPAACCVSESPGQWPAGAGGSSCSSSCFRTHQETCRNMPAFDLVQERQPFEMVIDIVGPKL